MKRTKTQKGITLIALIITIVVLLILAVVAIRAVQNTGIITHAKNATTEYHSKQDEEEIKLALEEWKIVKYTQADTTFESFLKSKFGESNVSEQNDDDSYTVTIAECGDRYKVYEDGTITPTKGISITATDFPLKIKNGATEMPTGTLKAVLIDIEGTVTWSIGDTAVATISATEGEEITVTAVAKGETKITATCGEYKAEYTIKVTVNMIGASIEYAVDLNDDGDITNDWKVFYKDDTHLYIIASDYLNNTKLPTELKMNTSDTYNAYWSTTSNFTSSKASDTITTEVASKYNLSWFSDTTKDSTKENARATADLLNVEAWTAKFGNVSKGIEAIGVPTLEMWIASWNASGYTPLYTAYNATGYYVGTSANPTSYEDVDLSSDTAGYGDTLYFPYQLGKDNCYGYWLASPDAFDSYGVMIVNRAGKVGNGLVGRSAYASTIYGVRPLVSLPSEILVENADGSLRVEV